MRVKVVKNKVAAPFRQAEFDIEYGQGISSEGCILDLGIEHDIVQKSGSFFSYEDERLGQGRNNVKAYLRENPEKLREIEAKIYETMGIEPGGAPVVAAVEDPPVAARRVKRAGRRRGAGGLAPPRPGLVPPMSEQRPPRGGRDPFERAVELAYRSISRRDRTVAEVRAFLERSDVEEQALEHALGELAEAGWLDDERFAQRFAEDKRTLERWGGERIERELLRRGVPAETLAAAAGEQDRDAEMAAALEILTLKPAPLHDDRERDRAWRLLVRKGYEPELAYEAVREFGRRAAA